MRLSVSALENYNISSHHKAPTTHPKPSCPPAAPFSKDKSAWIKVNAQQYGYFRVQYDDALWPPLSAAAR